VTVLSTAARIKHHYIPFYIIITMTSNIATSSKPGLLDLQGSFYMPGDEAYEIERKKMYAANAWSRSHSSPMAIAVVAGPADVQTCLQWATSSKTKVSVRSGGHNWFGSSLQQDTLLLDMSRLDTCHIDAVSKTATVGPCCTGQRLNQEAANIGLCFSTGHCPGVPLGGFLLGGGFGWFCEYFGMAVESVLGCTIVTADGTILDVTDETHSDWMWLVRGAGAAFPGVVTAFTLQLHPLPRIVKSRMSIHPLQDYEKIVQNVQQLRLTGSISTKVESNIIMACTPPPLVEVLGVDVPKVCIIGFSVIADSREEYQEALETMELIPSTPLVPYDEPQDYTFSSICETLRPAFPEGFRWMVTSHLLDIDNTGIDWAGVREAFQNKAPSAGPSSTLTVVGHCNSTAKDGAYGPVPSPGILVGTYGVYQDNDDSELAALQDFETSSNAVTAAHAVKCNVLEHQLNHETAPKIFVGPTGERLAALRIQLDPGQVFFDPTQANPW
jgi:hypothetical protein